MSPEHANVPGDGRYDQDFLPSELVWEVSPSYVFADLAMGATLGEAVN